MLIRVLLLATVAAIGYYAVLRRGRVPLHLVVVLGFLGVAALFVVFPEASNTIAHAVGVGRGADLVTYCFEVGLLFITLHYYTRFVDLESRVTALVRELALLRAELERRDGDPGGDGPAA